MAKEKTVKKVKPTDRKPRVDKVAMTVYDVVPMFEGITDIKLPHNLHAQLNLTSSAEERLMPLSSEEGDKDSDFVANFNYQGGFLFGSFVRLTAGQKSAVLFEHLKKKTIDINEMVQDADEKTAGSLNPPSFFCISGDLLVLNRARANVRALETYINWFFREHNLEKNQIKFVPKKNTAETIQLKDIRSIQLAETFLTPNNDKSNKNATEVVKFGRLKDEVLKLLVKDTKSMADYALDDIISATLTLKIQRKGLKKDNLAALDTALRIVNSDDVIITSKDNKRIRGTAYLIMVVRSIEQTSLGYYNEKQIETEMRKILKELKSGQVVS